MVEEQTSPSLLGIPLEVRMLIYDFLLSDRVCYIGFPRDHTVRSVIIGSLAILRLNKQIHAETTRTI